MRAERKKKVKMKQIGILLLVAIISYAIGFGEGQHSVYKKAKNDIEFRKKVWSDYE